MSDSCQLPVRGQRTPTTRWSVGGLLLEALAARDFAADDRLLRARGNDAGAASERACRVPGRSADRRELPELVRGRGGFEVLDGTVGEVGGRLHVAWRLRLRPTPWGDDDWHVIEQQAYVQAGERIDALDLLCSGFMPDGHS